MDDALTSPLLWRAAWVTALVDAPLLLLAARAVPRALFQQLAWYLAGSAFVVYAVIWGAVGSMLFWDAVYSAVFPGWARWLLPLIFGLFYAVLALFFWRAGMAAARGQALWFVLLGGMVSLVGHGIGATRGLFRVPMLEQASMAAALTFGVFEFIFYWCAILGLGIAVRKLAARG